MTLVGGWLVTPLVLVALCAGIGLLAERAAGVRVPGAALPGLGLAGLIAIAGLLTIADATAELAAPACAVAAVAGLLLGRHRRPSGPVVAVLAATFAVLAAPSLLSGQGSIAGYIKLDDSAIWLGLIAQLMEHGRHIADVSPSTYQLDLAGWLGQGYPVGALTPVGVVARLTGQDLANAYQPVLCVYGAVLAAGLYGVAATVLRSRSLAGACAVAGTQASLFAGYVWWGSIKEICVAALLPPFVLLARAGGVRALLLVGLVAGALMDCFGAGGVLWAGAGCVAAAVLALTRRPSPLGFLAASAGAFAVVAAASVPAIVVLRANAEQATQGSPVQAPDIGKLHRPLELLQGAGLWPAGDFRDPPGAHELAIVLAVAGLLAAAGAVAVAVRRRAWELPALLAAVLAGAVPAIAIGAPWIDAKVLAVTSSILLFAAAVLAALGLESRDLRVPAAVGVTLIAGGCLASSWLAARDVYVAPRDELTELRDLGRRVAGRGPTLVLGYEGYASRYFLRRGAPQGTTELRIAVVPSRSGEPFPDYSTVEVDDVDTAALLAFPALVRRQTPVGSRPPSVYSSLHAGRFFDTWARDPAAPVPVEHLSLGTALAPAAQVQCRRVRALAALGATLAALPRENPVVADPRHGGVTSVTLPTAGDWRVWVGGSTLGRLEVLVDGRSVGSVRHQLDASVGWLRFGAARLAAGAHTVALRTSESWWQAGRGAPGEQLPLGPLALTRETPEQIVRVPAAHADRLCDGRTYDWMEALPG